MMRLMVAVVFCMLAANANAAFYWLNNVEIEQVSYFWDGTSDIIQIKVKTPLPATTGCGPSDSNGYFYHTMGSSITNSQILRFNNAAAVVATNTPTDIRYESATCHSTYGLMWHGITFKKAP